MPNLLNDPQLWVGVWGDGPPPPEWDGQAYSASSQSWSEGMLSISLVGGAPSGRASGTVSFYNSAYEQPPLPGYLNLVIGGQVSESLPLSTDSDTPFDFSIPESSDASLFLAGWPESTNPNGFYGLDISITPSEDPPDPPEDVCEDLAADTVLHSAEPDPDRESFNCECEDGDRNVDTLCNLRERMVRRLGFVDPLSDGVPRTLAALRRDLLVRLGHAGSIDRPPPGMRELLDQIIAESEQLLWDRLELDRGGATRPARMEEDEDTTTLSPVLIFAQALGTAKAHYGKQDAQIYMQQAEKHLQDYVRQSPPGLRKTIDDFLREAQRFLYEKVASFRQSRYFRWPLEQGVRFYGYWGHEGGCGPFLPEMVEGVWVSHGDDEQPVWSPLHCGIDGMLYHAGIRENWPQRYEMRRCIEVWPAPDARGGYLRVKGVFDLNRFTEDDDTTTIDADVVFMLALANAKAHFNQPDAQKYDQLAQSRIGDIIAGSHHTRRHIPVDGVLPSANPPIAKDGFIPN